MIIQYYADSLGMPRSGHVNLEQRYIYLFQKWIREQGDEEIFFFDRARGAATIEHLYSLFKHDEDYITGSKDILIIHDGVVDCAPRPIPQFFRKLIARLPRQVREKVIRYIHKNRAKILKAGFRYYFTSRKKFKKILTGWLSEASNKFSRIYVINIAPTIPAIEKHSPGFSASIKEYNDIINEIIDRLKFENTFLVDVHSILLNSEFDMEELILKEDGHHITPLAHSLFANELIRLEAAYTTIHA